ncbi:glyoxalase [Agrobacterium tumefaciens]|nr:glyoxalase [Agrobacterium tumefaciens]
MTVRRIVANISTPDLTKAGVFYRDILGMTVAMDHGWIVTYASPREAMVQISFASEGGSGTAVPDLSIEIDNFDEVHAKILKAELPIEYGPVSEPWGVRRLFLRDPYGRLVNILSHS